MPTYSATSRHRLATCHKDLRLIFATVIPHFDNSILCGHRDEAAQMEAYNSGKSKVKWPNGKHNRTPSMAVDVAPLSDCLAGLGQVQVLCRLRYGRHLVWPGLVSTDAGPLTLKGTATPTAIAAPTSYNQGFFKGDQMLYQAPTASGFLGEVNVTVGNTGTWKTFGAVSA